MVRFVTCSSSKLYDWGKTDDELKFEAYEQLDSHDNDEEVSSAFNYNSYVKQTQKPIQNSNFYLITDIGSEHG
ncbi:unnamed protein product [Didymodactylos carnosus]|uniref:Uncharacterized protein n=1 Tax=Didymodactylos carnosus TaxID=1234261 RepID=A0A814U4R5_9BILA|nr:unnamed protein product [Didymodactylos carnosus]CAF3935406.1 unnamed protein product [Didymodactylos carnosus]